MGAPRRGVRDRPSDLEGRYRARYATAEAALDPGALYGPWQTDRATHTPGSPIPRNPT